MGCHRLLPEVLPTGAVVEAVHHVHLEPLPRQVGTARTFVRDHAPDDLPPDTQEVLVLLTSELVTNAVLHARTPIVVGLTVADEVVLVTVHDEDLARPQQRPYDGREGGWGLGLVAALAQDSSMTHHSGEGKTAWFVLPRGGPLEAAAGAAGRPGQDELGTAGL